MSSIIDKVLFNANFARQQTLNDDQILISLLQDFQQEYQNFAIELIIGVQFEQKIHRIKGTSALLGLERLSEYCAVLSTTVQSNELTEAELSVIQKKLGQLLTQTFDAITLFIGQIEIPKIENTQCDSVEIINEITHALENSEYIQPKKIEALKAILVPELSKKTVEEIVHNLYNFNYSPVLVQLNNLNK